MCSTLLSLLLVAPVMADALSVSIDVPAMRWFRPGQPLVNASMHWLGADSAASVPLPGGASVWLWGDTLLGSMSHGDRVIASMPRNSIAVQRGSAFEFFARTNASNLHDTHVGFFSPPNATNWLWLVTGFTLRGSLFLLGLEVAPDPAGQPGFDFRTVGSVVVRVPNPDDDPLLWQHTVISIPNTNASETWNAAAVVDQQRVYVLGQTGAYGGSRLGWLSVADVLRDDWANVTVVQDSVLAAFGPPETSLTFVPKLQRWIFFVVPFGSTQLQAVVSPSAQLDDTAAWTTATIWQIPKPWGDYPRVFCYAPKAHPELSNATSLFLTLCSNTPQIGDLVTNPEIYVPLTLRVSL